MSATVGVRELRQNLSVYLRRVRAGERLTVTERNVPVAELVPLPAESDPLARLIAEGKVTPATRSHRDRPARVAVPGDPYAGSRALQELRGDVV